MDYDTLDDVALISAIGQLSKVGGSNLELNEKISLLYDRFGRLVYSIAIHLVGDNETAEEITQDVFVQIFEGAHTYRPELSKVSSWIISITRHRAIDEIRKRSTRPEKDGVDWLDEAGEEMAKGIPSVDGPEGLVETRISQDRVRNVLSVLPEDQKQVLNLAYFGGYSQHEIAELLGEPLGTVKSRIRIAMQKIRTILVESEQT